MISFRPEPIDAFLAQDDGQPIFMINLLRFAPDGGRERYRDYLTRIAPIVLWHGGAIRFAGESLHAVCAEFKQAWDAIALISYPSRSAFANLIDDPDYAAAETLRRDALQDAVLQPLKMVRHA
ncbi:DUF1330 domain-containing protein [Sphingomonas sp. ASY06-1R]|jgi:uncharacterized protein (DUF1330 family)|uniref:DUF1330 domain-containing protein n=1 Tax=Sphingomonas sp. ASY06-1R TaxID=3445771 RepID=UPI003FA29F75